MDKELVIDVKRLQASFRDGPLVLKDINFSVYEGDVTVLLGGSGSGKTTVFRHLLGLYPLQSGYISLLGNDLSQITERKQKKLYTKLGVLYQNGALINSMSVAENIALPLVHHTDLQDDIIEQIVRLKLSLVNLSHAYYLYPPELSGGMLKRAALARAIIMDPPMLFCDEPGAGLDPQSMESLDNLILTLQKQLGMSIFMITHEVNSILRVADRIIYLDKGYVGFEGTLDEALKTDYEPLQIFFSQDHQQKKGI